MPMVIMVVMEEKEVKMIIHKVVVMTGVRIVQNKHFVGQVVGALELVEVPVVELCLKQIAI